MCAQLLQLRKVLTQLRRARIGGCQALQTCERFAARLGTRLRKVVAAAAGVGLEIQKACVLALQCGQQRKQRDVLVHVCEVSGMKMMSVLHSKL